jgi:hypothetical protein
MKRLLVVLGLALALGLALFVAAQADETAAAKAAAKAGPKSMTVTGELVDLGCYMGHGAKGEGHKECALKCAAMGMPLGLLTSKGTLYLLTINHDDAAPFNQCKDWMAQNATVTGTLMVRGGMKAIEVSSSKLTSPPKAE